MNGNYTILCKQKALSIMFFSNSACYGRLCNKRNLEDIWLEWICVLNKVKYRLTG